MSFSTLAFFQDLLQDDDGFNRNVLPLADQIYNQTARAEWEKQQKDKNTLPLADQLHNQTARAEWEKQQKDRNKGLDLTELTQEQLNDINSLDRLTNQFTPAQIYEGKKKRIELYKVRNAKGPKLDSSNATNLETGETDTTTKPTTPSITSLALNNSFQAFLSQSQPVVGVLYQGDLKAAALKLEAAIGKEINKPIGGMIWNETKQTFNTTTDDISKALNLISQHQQNLAKKADLNMDERLTLLAKHWIEK